MKSVVNLLAAAMLLFAAGAAGAQELQYKIDRVMGKADAPITIVEYASTTCPHCAVFHHETLPKLKAEWIDTGRAKLIYRDFPTGPKALSVGASMIAHCAGPERYFPLLGLIMDKQSQWAGNSNPLGELKKLAKLAGMGEDKVDACLKDQDLANAIEARAMEGYKKLGVESTPSILINGKLVPGGGVSYDTLNKALQAVAK